MKALLSVLAFLLIPYTASAYPRNAIVAEQMTVQSATGPCVLAFGRRVTALRRIGERVVVQVGPHVVERRRGHCPIGAQFVMPVSEYATMTSRYWDHLVERAETSTELVAAHAGRNQCYDKGECSE